MKRFTFMLTLTVGFALTASRASAEPVVLNAYENSNVQTNFELVFPKLGIQSTSPVFYTRYKLEIDEEAGTAKFVDYIQQIDPLALPLGISTGRLDIRISSSEGTYDAATRTFVTNDVYEINFANDLSTFGFDSPVILPATSRGTLSDRVGDAQNVEMRWEGSGELANEENPAEPYEFTYTCRVNTQIAASASDVPPLPTKFCADGLFSIFGLFAMGFGMIGLKRSARRMRR
ncbi:MAG: hypothetical protein IPK83_01285 [Planctomycetes bacterium]|nr:hypothetical protein [Planctomycetota bacterium]